MFTRATMPGCQAVTNSYVRNCSAIAQRKRLPAPGFRWRTPYIRHTGASAGVSRHHNTDTPKPAGDHASKRVHRHGGGPIDDQVDTGMTTIPAATRPPISGPPVVAVTEAVGDSQSHRYNRNFGFDGNGKFIAEPLPPRSLNMRAWHLAEEMLALVLPRGFPESVGYQYEEYARWQFMGMAASAAAGVMSTQALLFAMGLGAGAIPLAATLNWVIKDGLGQLGGVAFSGLVNTRFDANPKLWRIVAAVSLDASMILELLSPLAPAYFLPIASIANVGKNVSFLAASASRAAIHNVLCVKGNLADVTAKAGAQTILACMVGTGGGIALSTLLGSELHALIPACIGLSAVHLVANFMSIRRLSVPTFDSQRLALITEAYHESQGIMPTPDDLAAQEHIVAHALRVQLGLDSSPTVTVGSRLERAVRDRGELAELCKACEGLPFLLSVRGDLVSGTGEVHLLLLEGSTVRDVLAGSYIAYLARHLLLESGLRRPRREEKVPRLGGKGLAPLGEILPDVIAEALRVGGAFPVSPPTEAFGLNKGDGPRPPNGAGIAAEFIAKAESAGWDMSVLFLEKPGTARLRLVSAMPTSQDREGGC